MRVLTAVEVKALRSAPTPATGAYVALVTAFVNEGTTAEVK